MIDSSYQEDRGKGDHGCNIVGVAAPSTESTTQEAVPKRAHKKRKAKSGRLKKLWRRATGPPLGITCRKEFTELVVLANSSSIMCQMPGPSVVISGNKRQNLGDKGQSTEGHDHRDLIVNLLFGNDQDGGASSQKQKKRKLATASESSNSNGHLVNVPPLPSWASICNLGAVGGLAVIEVEVLSGVGLCPLFPFQRFAALKERTDGNVWSSLLSHDGDDKHQVQRKISAACKVRMFQGNKQPRCLSDVLMFIPPPPGAGATEAKQRSGDEFNLVLALKDLRMKPRQFKSEGFPLPLHSSSSDCSVAARTKIFKMTQAPSQVSSELNALQLVSDLAVEVTFGNEEDSVITSADDEHYVQTFSHVNGYENEERTPKVFSLDCEMVNTSVGLELARVSLIMHQNDEGYITVVDQLVKPRRTVLDYLTRFSGITMGLLQDVETRIEDVQVRLLALIDENDILIGHSLENDLKSLRLVHRSIVDTSLIFRGINGRKIGLKHLSNVLLRRKIQEGNGTSGHCSVEDAGAALVLALRRARLGSSFHLKEVDMARSNMISSFEKVAQSAGDASGCFASANGGSCVCIGPADWIKRYAQSAGGSQHILNCRSLLDPMTMAVPSWLSDKASKRAGFVWTRLVCEGEGKRLDQEVAKLDELVEALVNRVPSSVPILMIFQRGFEKVSSLTLTRKAALSPKSTCGWTSVQEDEWKRCLDDCRNCEAIWLCSK